LSRRYLVLVRVGLGVALGVARGVPDGLGVGVGLGEGDGTGDGDGAGVGEGDRAGVGEGDGEATATSVAVAAGEGDGVPVAAIGRSIPPRATTNPTETTAEAARIAAASTVALGRAGFVRTRTLASIGNGATSTPRR
jgi:hypothetical protein